MKALMRAACIEDLQAIYEMAKLTGGGFTNLPADRAMLTERLERSARAFARRDEAIGDDIFILVLEDQESGEVCGTCQLFSQVGQRWPFYSYRIVTLSQHSTELNRSFHCDLLTLCNDLNGASEVGGLFLHPKARAGGLGLLLARTRYMFIAMHRSRFANRVLAELRGVIDEAGRSPFWDGIAGKFFGMSFTEADAFNARYGNQFIADLMPKHPIYIPMLSESARTVIGVPHTTGRAAMRMLQNEGFAYENYLDIFDGGPTMTANTDSVHSVANTRCARIAELSADSAEAVQSPQAAKALVAVGKLGDFRSCYGQVTELTSDDSTDSQADSADIVLDSQAAAQLGVAVGDSVYWVAR